METYLFSFESVISILRECYREGSQCESGGILVGPKDFGRIVTDALPSTSFAERRSATYCQNKKDVELLNEKLKQYQGRGLDFRGYFHRHPPSGPSGLSEGDVETAIEVLRSPNYFVDNRLLMVVVTEHCSEVVGFPIFCYVVCLGSKGDVVVGCARLEILPKDSIEAVGKFIWIKTKNKGGCDEENNHFKQCGGGNEGFGQGGSFRDSDREHNNNKLIAGKAWLGKGWHFRSK